MGRQGLRVSMQLPSDDSFMYQGSAIAGDAQPGQEREEKGRSTGTTLNRGVRGTLIDTVHCQTSQERLHHRPLVVVLLFDHV